MDSDDQFLEDIKKLLNDSPEEDPYEKGFADKLYEGEEENGEEYVVRKPQRQQPAIRAYNADYHRESQRSRAQYDVPEAAETGDSEWERPRRSSRVQSEETQSYRAVQEDNGRVQEERRGYDEPDDDMDERKPKKKHRFWRGLLKFALVLILICALLTGILFLIAKQPTDSGCDLARKSGCSTILLAGTDASGDRTDTLMLLSINRKEGRLSLMSIPRDTKVNSTYTPHKINGAYGVNGAGEHGMQVLLDYVSECVGFRPDGYMLIDLNVFVDLVDLMGGVRFEVPCDMYYNDPTQDLYINLQAGEQTLNGEQAMGVVRFRSGYAMADLERVNVQRAFLSAAMKQWIRLKNVWKIPKVAKLLSENTLTDLNTANLLWLAESVLLCGTGDMQMMTIPHGLSGDGEYVLIQPEEMLDVVNSYFNPYEKEITMDDLYIAQ